VLLLCMLAILWYTVDTRRDGIALA